MSLRAQADTLCSDEIRTLDCQFLISEVMQREFTNVTTKIVIVIVVNGLVEIAEVRCIEKETGCAHVFLDREH